MQVIPGELAQINSIAFQNISAGDTIPVPEVPSDSGQFIIAADSSPVAKSDSVQYLIIADTLPVTKTKSATRQSVQIEKNQPVPEIPSDSGEYLLAGDTIPAPEVQKPEPLVLGKPEKTIYPRSTDIISTNVPDIYLLLVLLCFGFVAWSRIFYEKFLASIFKSSLSYSVATKVYEEAGLVQKRIQRLFFGLFLLSAGLYLYALSYYFGWTWPPENTYLKIGAFIAIPAGVSLFRYLLMSLTGYLFRRQKLFAGYMFHHFINSRMLGILLLPFLILIPYTEGISRDLAVYMSLSMIVIVYIIKIYRALRYIMKNVIFIFYLILYLCALELLPLLVTMKLILSLA